MIVYLSHAAHKVIVHSCSGQGSCVDAAADENATARQHREFTGDVTVVGVRSIHHGGQLNTNDNRFGSNSKFQKILNTYTTKTSDGRNL